VPDMRRVILYLLLITGIPTYSQYHYMQFDHIGTEQGLSHSNVMCIMQDSRGFMWFGTWDGLDRYDGYAIKAYKNDALDKTSICQNSISSIVESKDGGLWIGTGGGGISKYDRNRDRFTNFSHDSSNPNSICSNIVWNLLEDEQGEVWVATEEGLDRFDPRTGHFEHFMHDPANKYSLSGNRTLFVFEDSQRRIWVCTDNGLNLFDRKNKRFDSYRNDKKDINSIGGNIVNTIFEDSHHRFWIGFDGAGMDLFDPETGKFSHYRHNRSNPNSLADDVIADINEDADNNLWIATENKGVNIFNYEKNSFFLVKNDKVDKESLDNNSINNIYRDTKNNMWVGNFVNGVNIANRDKIRTTHYRNLLSQNSLSNNQVLSIMEDSKKNIWIGTDGGGLNLFDPRAEKFTHFMHQDGNPQSICGDYVLTMCEDTKGNIWLGTWGKGVTVFNPVSHQYRHYKNDPNDPASLSNNNAWVIYEDKGGNTWIGTSGGGLNLLNPDKKSFTHFKYEAGKKDCISSNYISYFFEDSDGQLWICTNGGGLNRYNKETKTFSRFMHADATNSISNNNVSSILEDENKNLWIATYSGLDQFNKRTGQFTAYTKANGLPDNVIFGILQDNMKNLWMSTNKGISYFNTSTKQFKNFGISDGLQSNEFKGQAFCKSSTGIMYFGGINGFNRFLPEDLQVVKFDPPLVITGFTIFNRNVPITDGNKAILTKNITETKQVTLPYSSSVFSLEFASLNYTSSEKKQYAYQLEGFDKDWNYVGEMHTATYTNLDPGTYLFKVKGMNNEGDWSPRITTIQLTIKPPFYRTWWFRILLLMLLTGGILMIYALRMRSVRKQRLLLEHKVVEQTIQLVHANEEVNRALSKTDKANEELERKNKELEQFVYIASHDLREPLRTTTSFVQLLERQYKGKFDEKADTYLQYITDSSERMKVLIDDLLDYSRIDKQREAESVDCGLLLNEVLTDLNAAIKETNAIITASPLPVINAYRTQLKQLFQNLVFNAIKFRQKDIAPVITISVTPKGDHWQFSITDNGIGIDPRNQDRVFGMFQRLHSRNEYEGSGIGLAFCKKIVELHQGTIWVESAVGQGSSFHFMIRNV
jgi:signal transduction histidine kinase/ligand-binding sensor domain-containing protein